MKLILSRKGFDSAAGGIPSPIFSGPSNRMISFPIPGRSRTRYCDIDVDVGGGESCSMGHLVHVLSKGKAHSGWPMHLDPDLDRKALTRHEHWRPLFGQAGAAQTHLEKQGVDVGDLFLFFGWFREVESHHETWRYVPGAPDKHVLFGWLQIGEIVPVDERIKERLPWALEHPHVARPLRAGKGKEAIYVASKWLTLPDGAKTRHPGAGTFSYNDNLVLTERQKSRSNWLLPEWFLPAFQKPTLSYHTNPNKWNVSSNRVGVRLKTVGRGQEFVIDIDYAAGEASLWIDNLIQHRNCN